MRGLLIPLISFTLSYDKQIIEKLEGLPRPLPINWFKLRVT